ncbi:hypothetical protein SRABI118_03091 [Massilia sp. Bi118]|uniref:hypothetical protein n=1 Tax=Massilia sp. Bi118 TaxID=2822346 RepID=UPI001DD04373|nr:hypothetical protein [Massilia sp. Bi118]CAH0255814.1 hypothetical protein SRABI118_03091 [Massilia sp. Bi118]
MKRFLICFAMLLPFSVSGQDYLPRDVQRLIDLRAGCEPHGSCATTGKELVQLKRKYAANSTIMQILNQFDIGTDTADIVETPAPAPAPKKKKAQTRRVRAK